MGVVVEEADESVFWLELMVDAGIVPVNKMSELIEEAKELVAVFGASYRTSRSAPRCNNSIARSPDRAMTR
jgi:hypothetical protein